MSVDLPCRIAGENLSPGGQSSAQSCLDVRPNLQRALTSHGRSRPSCFIETPADTAPTAFPGLQRTSKPMIRRGLTPRPGGFPQSAKANYGDDEIGLLFIS
jgi:hypothetical protein